jgi:cell division protease FtsH
MNRFKDIIKNLALWITIALIMIFAFNFFNSPQFSSPKIAFSQFLQQVESGNIKEVTIKGQKIVGVTKDNKPFETYTPYYPKLIDKLNENDVKIDVKPDEGSPWYITVLVSWLPMIFLILLWISMMRQMSAGGNKALSFAKSRAKIFIDNKPKVRFKDVAGIEEVKDEVAEVVEFLKNPKKFQQLGGRIPKGVLLAGAPGTGKTLLAKAIAGEANVPFLSVSGSEFVEMFVGVGASRVRDLFDQAKRNAPCIVFIDEIDAVGRKRSGAGFSGGHDEREQTLNQLLVEMDGFESSDGIIVIAATNRPDVLDQALLRPGRFDRQIFVPLPDVKGRLEILKLHTEGKPLSDDVDLEIIARSTPGFSGADLANIVNEAALIAARKNHGKIFMEDFEEAKDKVTMGIERKSLVLSEEERVSTAYHEAGHALVAKLLPKADKVHKVTIIPRGKALGITQQLPEDEKYTYTKDYLLDRLAVLFGGRVAEEVALGTVSSGAGNDIERATEIAKKMVAEWGMSEKIGPIAVKTKEQFGEPTDIISEDMKRLVDREVKRILSEAYERTRQIIVENMGKLENLAKTLLERETLTGEEIDLAMDGKPIPEPPKKKPSKRKEEIPIPETIKPQIELG